MNYKAPNFNPNNLLVDEPSSKFIFEKPFASALSDILPNTVDKIDKILGDEFSPSEMVGLEDIWFVENKKH